MIQFQLHAVWDEPLLDRLSSQFCTPLTRLAEAFKFASIPENWFWCLQNHSADVTRSDTPSDLKPPHILIEASHPPALLDPRPNVNTMCVSTASRLYIRPLSFSGSFFRSSANSFSCFWRSWISIFIISSMLFRTDALPLPHPVW